MKFFERFSEQASVFLGSPIAFAVAVSIIVLWATTGPLFRFSDTWQLVINTGTTIVTFLLGFVIANAQNRQQTRDEAKIDSLERIELKIDEHVEQSIGLTREIHAALPATGCGRHQPQTLCVECMREAGITLLGEESA